ncbi:hypothetical protein M427DRAFT_70932 [Gonapodya prolifera JEL478]|uniref:Transmembrane protein n=1 Tax=Gonapodya prolifera (strain JEL478) TaxID=1344416 RepID=A0A139ABR3_GONPJ|nr:hypothetical protein M427DRAFT_70932 [Gonapodya prolifera JEL478]|eukprot:KXS14044.1 hypothetical protein M427DRAFT_70932 [Gonapodya prolifera JEL478]
MFYEWRMLADTLDSKELSDRAKNYWQLVCSVSGLTSGFTYLVSNSGVTFDPSLSSTILGIDRKALCGGLVAFAFLFCLSATLWSATLYGELNMLGDQDAKWFISRFWYLCDSPFVLCGIGIVLMLANGAFVLGGLYDNHALFYTVLTFGVVAMLAYFYLTTVLEKVIYEKIRKRWVDEGKRDDGRLRGSLTSGSGKGSGTAGKVEPEVESSKWGEV